MKIRQATSGFHFAGKNKSSNEISLHKFRSFDFNLFAFWIQVRLKSFVWPELANWRLHNWKSDGEHYALYLSDIRNVCCFACEEEL